MNEHSAEKRSQILDAAQKRFAHYGLKKVTMDEIAGDLGTSKASLYYYFKTKEEVFREVISREQTIFLDLAEKILNRNQNSSDKFRGYCLQRVQYLNELANLKLLGIHAWLDIKPIISDLMQSFCQHEKNIILRIITEGKKNDEFQFKSIEKTAEVIIDVLYGLGFRVYKTSNEFSSNQELFSKLREETNLLIELLLHGLTT